MEQKRINVIGAGLAGSECAYYLARKGYKVDLYEQRPIKKSPAHETDLFGELVCSNSLKNKNLDNACGLLKEEMRRFDSLILEAASHSEVPAGNALSVDRTLFAEYITSKIKSHPNITIHNEEVTSLKDGINIIATGPLTSEGMASTLRDILGEDFLSFYDAAAPIVEASSIDMNIAYKKSRYEQGDDSYINCPFDKEQFDKFYEELIHGERAKLHDFDQVFEACMPIEVIAQRGDKTLRFGPMKPKGLRKPDGSSPYAVVQLRQDNVTGSLYNIVGFQTNLKYGEQKRIFSMIPGLENAKFVRYGLMHRNTYICAPKYLNKDFSLKGHEDIYVVGQLSGVEGYVESTMAGLVAAIYLDLKLQGKEFDYLPNTTMTQSIINYITMCSVKNFGPMNANFGIMVNMLKDREEMAKRSLGDLDKWKEKCNL
jgi:methylenetetrahydrofolate--tRNA-(uracil-5-)-methyltransferase